MATLKELAAYTNLSIATISRILNNDPTMVASEDTRRRVLEAAGALGYKKHNKGKVSAVLRFGVAEMLTPAEQLEDPFYLYLKNFVAQECMEQKIDLIPLLRDGESFTCAYPLPLNGIIAIGIFTRAQIEALHQLSDTLIFVDSSPDEARSDSVVINYRLGIEHALDHLFSLGHRQIGFVGPADKLDDWKQPAPEVRRQLFIHFMSARNDYDSSFLIDVPTNAALTERAVAEHLRQGKPLPTAFLTANEENAIGTVRALKAAGLSIPQDVSIISFNDTPLSELMEPPLTSVSTRVQEMSSIAVHLLTERSSSTGYLRDIPVKLIVPPTLVVRASTTAPPVGCVSDDMIEMQDVFS